MKLIRIRFIFGIKDFQPQTLPALLLSQPLPQPLSDTDFQGCATIRRAERQHGLKQPDLMGGLLRLELEHPWILDDVQDGGTLVGLT